MSKPTINDELVRQLAKLLDETGLTEIEYGEGKWRLRVSKAMTAAAAATVVPVAAVAAAVANERASQAGDDVSRHPDAITSPMVGTVYTAPQPGAAPFVNVGDTVSEGQTLLLIEAMKTMNPIRAPRAGKVSQILTSNAAPVEYGEVLLILE